VRGIVIAVLVLMPQTWQAWTAVCARTAVCAWNRGVPACVAVTSILVGRPLELPSAPPGLKLTPALPAALQLTASARSDARGGLRDQLRLAFFSRFTARFSSSVFAGFFFVSFFRSIPLLMFRAPRKCR
jgi:hypothetical protein